MSETWKCTFNVTLNEILNFAGLIFLSGYNIRLPENDYWRTDPDLSCDVFPETMTQNRFFELRSFLHAADNHSLDYSQMAKVEPFSSIKRKASGLWGFPQRSEYIDESMALYYGCHSCKQCICAKSIRFGYKLWVLTSATGLTCNVEIYVRKSANDTAEPLETCVLKNVLNTQIITEYIYFDNFLSSYQLVSDFDKRGFRATWTMRKDGVMKCLLIDMKQIMRKEKESYD